MAALTNVLGLNTVSRTVSSSTGMTHGNINITHGGENCLYIIPEVQIMVI
jgi:hypothetical protein